MPLFNKEEFLIKWDEDNPAFAIPEFVQPEQDRDWPMAEEEEEAMIQQYFQSKEEK